MIRFCDREVYCVLYDDLDRNLILNYFFQGHMDEIICVTNTHGRYKGKISYFSLINAEDAYHAIMEDFVCLDKNVWKNARHYFSNYERKLNEAVLLPIVDKNGKLLCFTYEETEANREIRMLRELSQNENAIQFLDLFPDYKCVRIYGFNELAYFFAEYLKKQNIEVQAFGELWNYLVEKTEKSEDDANCYSIYAEGIYQKKGDWIENLLESVSVEFECIDYIYAANVKNGVFRDGGYFESVRPFIA